MIMSPSDPDHDKNSGFAGSQWPKLCAEVVTLWSSECPSLISRCWGLCHFHFHERNSWSMTRTARALRRSNCICWMVQSMKISTRCLRIDIWWSLMRIHLLALCIRPWPQPWKWEDHYGGMFFYCHYTYKRPGKCLQHPKKWFSHGAFLLKKGTKSRKLLKNSHWMKIQYRWSRAPIPFFSIDMAS